MPQPERRGTLRAKLSAIFIAAVIGAVLGGLVGAFIGESLTGMAFGAIGAGGIIGVILFFLDDRPA